MHNKLFRRKHIRIKLKSTSETLVAGWGLAGVKTMVHWAFTNVSLNGPLGVKLRYTIKEEINLILFNISF